MNRDTLKYVSRRVEESRQMDDAPARHTAPNSEYDMRVEHPISARYGNSTNTYRAEGTIEGRIEHHNGSEGHTPHRIGFGERSKHDDRDYLYALEESFEKEIDDIVYYSELAMEAETKGHVEFANGFYEIAKEKLTCAEFIRHRLVKSGEYKPEHQTEIEDRFDRAKHLFRRL